MEMNEKEVLDLIKSGEKFLLKAKMENCPACDAFAPIWDKVSKELKDYKFIDFLLPKVSTEGAEFKREYMKQSFQGEKIGAPAVFLFEGGKLMFRHFSGMGEEELKVLATTTSEQRIENAKISLNNLFLRRGQLTFQHELFLKEMPQVDAGIKEISEFLGQQ